MVGQCLGDLDQLVPQLLEVVADADGPFGEFGPSGSESASHQSESMRRQLLCRLLPRVDERDVPGFDLRPGVGAVLGQNKVGPASFTRPPRLLHHGTDESVRYPQECSPTFDRPARFEFVDGFPEPGQPPDQRTQRSQRRQGQASEQPLGSITQPFDIVGDHRTAGRSHAHRDRQRDLPAHLAGCHLLEDVADSQGTT